MATDMPLLAICPEHILWQISHTLALRKTILALGTIKKLNGVLASLSRQFRYYCKNLNRLAVKGVVMWQSMQADGGRLTEARQTPF